MDDHRRSRSNEKHADQAEGVRIIGPDEAAEAIERGEVAARRTDDELRYGDRPPAPPAGPRPALRFPLDASADPTRIERPPVQPAPDPVSGPVSLPHWTDPPTGEVPAVLIGDDAPLIEESEEDLDAWSSFATSTPRWRDADDDWGDDGFVERLAESGEVRVGALGDQDAEPSHEEYFGFDDLEERVEERTGDLIAPEPGPRWELPDDDWAASAQGEAPAAEVDEVEAWTDGDEWGDDDVTGEPEVDDLDPAAYDDELAAPIHDDPSSPDRDMGSAVLVGGGLLVALLVTLALGPKFTVVLVAAILGLCAGEYFGVLRKVGWEAAGLLGMAAAVLFPLAIYWRGPGAFGLVGFLTVAAVLTWYLVGAGGPDPRVLEGTGATLLGVAWIGGLGSAAAGILTLGDGASLLLVAVLATVAHDVAALFGGKAIGHRPLSDASPNKTVEGVLCGMAAALVTTVVLVGGLSIGPWDGVSAALLLGLGAAVAAPLGDLCQSLLKRDLGVKDMGSLLPGHGGVLDRFDSMLFVLPVVYWLAVAVGHVF